MTDKRVAYLTMADMGNFVTDFDLSYEPMRSLGWEVDAIDWRSRPDWDSFDAVYICTPWDYPLHVREFESVLQDIELSNAVLFNALSTVRWNLEKTYMRDVEARGGDIVPSLWFDNFDPASVPDYFRIHGVNRVVIKPTIGANATDTFVVQEPVPDDVLRKLQEAFSGRAHFVQPFIESIQTEGEFSLFFFDGEFSHAIRKTPAPGDFRVQEEHGADILPESPPAELLQTAITIFSGLQPMPVYGRGDWVRGVDGRFLLMELELIEPSLYLRTDSGAATRFARAFDQRFQELSGK